MRVSWPWAYARWVNSCACRAQVSPDDLAQGCSPISTACWGAAPIPAHVSYAASDIAACAISITKSRITNASCTRLRRCWRSSNGFLRVRQRGITALQCRFHHYRAPPTLCTLRLAAPETRCERFIRLLRERLATLTLPEPVRRCELRSGALTDRSEASKPLWSSGEHGHANAGEMPALVEHLRARLGVRAVHGIARVSEHRPENAWRVAEPKWGWKMGTFLFASKRGAPEAVRPFRQQIRNVPISIPFRVRRPLWLLQAPRPLESQRGRPRHDGPLELLAGPERIESGWWDGADVQRDYYMAQKIRAAAACGSSASAPARGRGFCTGSSDENRDLEWDIPRFLAKTDCECVGTGDRPTRSVPVC